MIVALTLGGVILRLSLPPTRSRTVAVNRASFFNTCGGCSSTINVLKNKHASSETEFTAECQRCNKWNRIYCWMSDMQQVKQNLRLNVRHATSETEFTAECQTCNNWNRGLCWMSSIKLLILLNVREATKETVGTVRTLKCICPLQTWVSDFLKH